MGWNRRRYHNALQAQDSVLGGHFSTALNNIDKLTKRVFYATVDFDATLPEVVTWLVAADHIEKLKAAKSLTSGNDRFQDYDIDDKASIVLDYDAVEAAGLPMLSAAEKILCIDKARAAPLFNAIADLRVVHQQFQCVLTVLRWMDANATAGAIRQYWPTMAVLAPRCEDIQGGAPTRYQEPLDIAPMLPLIRETAGYVASALMLPDKTRDGRGLTLTLKSESYKYQDVTIDSQSITVVL